MDEQQKLARIARADAQSFMQDSKLLGFKANEQNAMAELCQLMASVSWAVNAQGLDPSDSCLDGLASIAEKFASVNWGEMYDKFHRQGVNR